MEPYVRSILDDVGGGPMLLSRLMAKLYEQLPAAREEVRAARSASWGAVAALAQERLALLRGLKL